MKTEKSEESTWMRRVIARRSHCRFAPSLTMQAEVTRPTLAGTAKVGKTAPSKETSVNGWDYWTRVYNGENRQRHVAQQRDMRISDLLASEALVRAKLIFLNVPGLPTGYKNILLQLIKKELKEDLPIQDVVVTPGKWFINFYRPEDALKVLKAFNGFTYHSHTLTVRFCKSDGTYGDEAALAELVSQSALQPVRLVQPSESSHESSQSVWTKTENEGIRQFEKELLEVLFSTGTMHYQSALAAIRTALAQKKLPSYFINDAIVQWATGFLRLFPKAKVVGTYICLTSSPSYTQRVREAVKEGACAIAKDPWEPCVPSEIRSEVQLRDYAEAFLQHFGPQHVRIDLPIRILSQTLPGIWPKTGHELARTIAKISSMFVVINDFLYFANNERHHEHIVDNLASYQYDSDDGADVDLEFVAADIASSLDTL